MCGEPHLLAWEYKERANQFFKAYHSLTPTLPPDWPRYFLACHAVELCLKSYLAAFGISEKDLSNTPYRHNISETINKALVLGLVLEQDFVDDVTCLSQAHNDHWHRYPMKKNHKVFVIEKFDAAIEELFRSVQSYLYPNLS